MVGRYRLEINGLGIRYKFNIDRAITIIKGNSGTGKTTLCKIVYEVIKGNKGYSSNMSDKLYVLDSISPWEILLKTIKKKIIFVDENSRYIYTSEFADLAQKSDNYFVIISRRALDSMTYSYKSIYELQTSKKGSMYETELVYKFRDNIGNEQIKNHDTFLCEDRKSGYQMMKLIIKNNSLLSASGKDNIANIIRENKHKIFYVMADGAGFGNCIESIVALYNEGIKITILLNESFEKMILEYPKYYEKYKEEIDSTYNYCDTKLFKSYERYYTYLLNEICKKMYNKQYNKSRLINELKSDSIVKFIKSRIICINDELFIQKD